MPEFPHGISFAVDPLCPPNRMYLFNPKHIYHEGDDMKYVADSYDKTTDQFCQTITVRGGYRWVRFHPHGRPRTRLYDDVIPRSQYEAELALSRPVELVKDDLIDTLETELAKASAIVGALHEALRVTLNVVDVEHESNGDIFNVYDYMGQPVELSDRVRATINACLSQ